MIETDAYNPALHLLPCQRSMVQILHNRSAKHGQPPPIIAITARASTADMQLAESLGCAAFTGKPFLPADLVKVVSGFLRSAR